MMKKPSILWILYSLTAMGLTAQPLELDVEQAVELALSRNVSILTGQMELAQAEREYRDRWNVLVPDLSITASLNRSNEPQTLSGQQIIGTVPGSVPGTYDQVMIHDYSVEMDPWTLIGGIGATLALNPALVNGAKQLELNSRSTLLDLESSTLLLDHQVRKSFYQLLLIQEQINLLEKNIATMENRLFDMEAMYSNGLITQLDLLQTQSALSQMRPSLSSLISSYQMATMAFALDLGLDLDQEIILIGEVEFTPISIEEEDLEAGYEIKSHEMEQLLLNRRMAENGLQAAVNQLRSPSLVISYNYQPVLADPFTGESWEDGDNWMDNGSLTLSLSVPVEGFLPHSAGSNSITRQEMELQALDLQIDQARQAIELQIQGLLMNLENSQEIMLSLEEQINLNRESYRLTLEAYQNGQKPLSEVETAENDLLQAESQLIAEKFNYISNKLDLERQLNGSL